MGDAVRVVVVADVWVGLRAVTRALDLTFWAHYECLEDSSKGGFTSLFYNFQGRATCVNHVFFVGSAHQFFGSNPFCL